MTEHLQQICGHTVRLPLGPAPLVVDLGANVGEFSWALLDSHPDARLVLVEGDPLLVGRLATRFAARPGVQLFQGLVGAESRSRTKFHLSGVPEGNSLRREFAAAWSSGETREIEVEMIALPKLLDLLDGPVDLLKVDIEGAEWDVLQTLDSEHAARIGQITVEFHDFLDPGRRPLTETTIARLEVLGYDVHCRAGSHVHGSPYFDCLFSRPQ